MVDHELYFNVFLCVCISVVSTAIKKVTALQADAEGALEALKKDPRLFVCLNLSLSIYIYICIHLFVYIKHIYIYIHVYVYIYIYTHTYTYVYTCIYIYIYT